MDQTAKATNAHDPAPRLYLFFYVQYMPAQLIVSGSAAGRKSHHGEGSESSSTVGKMITKVTFKSG